MAEKLPVIMGTRAILGSKQESNYICKKSR